MCTIYFVKLLHSRAEADVDDLLNGIESISLASEKVIHTRQLTPLPLAKLSS